MHGRKVTGSKVGNTEESDIHWQQVFAFLRRRSQGGIKTSSSQYHFLLWHRSPASQLIKPSHVYLIESGIHPRQLSPRRSHYLLEHSLTFPLTNTSVDLLHHPSTSTSSHPNPPPQWRPPPSPSSKAPKTAPSCPHLGLAPPAQLKRSSRSRTAGSAAPMSITATLPWGSATRASG
jgi:hypothetical protein